MDEKTRNALARIAAQWHQSTSSSRVGHGHDSGRRRVSGNGDNSAMTPVALRHRRYQQLLRLRRAG